MKNWFLHILLLAGLFGMLTTSCSQEEGLEPQAQSSKEKIQVSFSISNCFASTDSRAITLSGNEFENKIDTKMLFVQLDLDGKICDVNKLTCFNIGTNAYNIVGEIDIESSDNPFKDAKIIVHANIPSGQTEFDVKYNLFPHKGVDCIPMWGVKTIENLTLTPGVYNNFGTIDLLRSMAKIEVILGDDVVNKGYRIDKAGLGKYNTKGYLRPKDWDKYAQTTDFYTIDEDCCNSSPYKNVAVDPSTLGLEFEVASDGKSCTIYVPEYDYQKDGDDVMIHLEFKDNEQTTVNLQSLGIFSMGEQDLIRNHWYKYEIINIKSGVDMEVIISINPWNNRDVSYPNTPLI